MKLKHLKRDRALLMTSILLVLMLGAGIFSGIVGFTLGHAALKGVTQPDIRPNNKALNDQNLKSRTVEILNEKELVADAQEVMGIATKDEDTKPGLEVKDKPTVVFPIESKDQGILLIVKSVKPEGNNFKLDLSLRNQGAQAAKFNQGVLTVSDESGKSIASNFTGLPQTLLANGKDVNLKVLVPKNAVAKSKNVSLRLTDADRKLEIEVADIPIEPATPKPSPTIKIDIPDGQLETVKDKDDEQLNKNKNKKPKNDEKPSADQPKKATKPPAPKTVKPTPAAESDN
jgi:hypothetical protein